MRCSSRSSRRCRQCWRWWRAGSTAIGRKNPSIWPDRLSKCRGREEGDCEENDCKQSASHGCPFRCTTQQKIGEIRRLP
jgi:hypothetical protein